MSRSVLALVLVALFAPAAAHASTTSTDGGAITIVGGPESSDITIGTGLLSTGIRDAAGITAGPGCTQSSPDSVSCGSLASGRVIDADLGDGADTIGTLMGTLGTVRGGPGNDELNGDSGANRLYGDAGSDVLYGGDGDDYVDGGPGTDQIFGDSAYLEAGGADTLVSRDGERDEVTCGVGYDVVTADPLDVLFLECDKVDRGGSGTAPARTLPTMSLTDAKIAVRRALSNQYKVWRRGSQKRLGPALRLSRTSFRFSRISVRYRGRSYRGWATTKFIWEDGEVLTSTRFILRRQ